MPAAVTKDLADKDCQPLWLKFGRWGILVCCEFWTPIGEYRYDHFWDLSCDYWPEAEVIKKKWRWYEWDPSSNDFHEEREQSLLGEQRETSWLRGWKNSLKDSYKCNCLHLGGALIHPVGVSNEDARNSPLWNSAAFEGHACRCA